MLKAIRYFLAISLLLFTSFIFANSSDESSNSGFLEQATDLTNRAISNSKRIGKDVINKTTKLTNDVGKPSNNQTKQKVKVIKPEDKNAGFLDKLTDFTNKTLDESKKVGKQVIDTTTKYTNKAIKKSKEVGQNLMDKFSSKPKPDDSKKLPKQDVGQ